MAFGQRIHAIILPSVILIMGIIHLGVGIGIAAKYRKYNDIFRQQVGLSGYNIFIGLCAITTAILGLVSLLYKNPRLSKIAAIASFVLGILTFASLITALALSGRTAGYLRDTISDNMNNYIQDQDSIDIINKLQSKYECCGTNLWLDWARLSLGLSNGIGIGRRRRQHSSPPISPLNRALRQKRQIRTPRDTVYNLPDSYKINLPPSCCKNYGSTDGSSLGGYCVFNSDNDSSNFYVSGCLEPVSNTAFSQIAGIAVINTCLTIFAFLYFAKLINLFPNNTDSNNSNNKQPSQNQIYQGQQPQPQQQQVQQQHPYEQYYANNNNLHPYYINSYPTYKTYL